MGRLKRMTESEFEELKKQYDELDNQYKDIKEKRALVKRKIDWYTYSKDIMRHSYRQGLSYELFGKRKKDLSPEELREYNRISARRSREKLKEQMKGDDDSV